MRRLLMGLLVCGAAAGTTPAVHAAEPLDVVKKAIDASGGKEKIAKFRAAVLEGKGTVEADGMTLKYDAVWKIETPERYRIEIDTSVNDVTIKIVQVWNGKEGWMKLGDGEPMAMSDDQIANIKKQLQVDEAARLVPLLDTKAYKVASTGDVKVKGKPAVGLNVTNKSGLDVNLYLDPKTYLLIKEEYQTRTDDGRDVTQTIFLGGYKKVDGMPYPTTLEIQHDGKKVVTAEFSSVQLKEKLDDGEFKKP